MAQAVGSADATTEAPLLLSSMAGTPLPLLAGAPRRNRFAFVCATLASVATMLHGYSLTLMSGAELFMREDVGLTDAEVEVLAGVHERLHARVHPRRRLGGRPFAALMAARFVTSVGSGFAPVVAPVYNAEISPPSTRGVLSSMLDVRMRFGYMHAG
ncbi:unnamed protein product [Miscanthus lutarioriparius]|uniref:Major facilitator superfamily (MFS) profile domain-containing protein n=1 Tax=Miscanthus lutarioriparius TaxID=422564 RepID=A0A811NPX7_9POAL|nr:unnamed protein product [Miscanthus lutarioriparius]